MQSVIWVLNWRWAVEADFTPILGAWTGRQPEWPLSDQQARRGFYHGSGSSIPRGKKVEAARPLEAQTLSPRVDLPQV